MKKPILAILLILTWTTALSQITDPQSIYNGQPINNAVEAPWVVQIRRAFLGSDNYRVSCTGVIISNRHILTAAHCVTRNNCDYPESTTARTDVNYRVLFGTTNIDSEDPDYGVIDHRDISNIYIHGEYNGYATKDIAILEFENPLEFSDNIQPISFEHSCPPVNDGLNIGDDVKLFGWGVDYDGDGQTPDILQSGQLEITHINPDNVTAGLSNDGSSSTFGTPCSGDSGGPLVKEINGSSFLVGILSTGNGAGENCPNGTRGEWERVSYYSSFIDYYINHPCKPNISKLNNVCYSNASTVGLSNIYNTTTTWTTSNNIQVISSTNLSTDIKAKNSTSSGSGWVKAILNNGIELYDEFEVGVPNIITLPYSLHVGESFTMGSFFMGTWNRVHIICNQGCGQHSITQDMDWNITATNSAIMHNNGANNASIKPNASQIRVSYEAFNECGCSATRFQDFNVIGGGSSGGSGHNPPPSNDDPILIPVDDGGILDPTGLGSGGQFIPTGGNNN